MSEPSLKQKTKRGLYWKFFDQLAGQGMQFVVGIVMARLLSPQDFGIAALPTVFISIARIFTESGFGVALVRKSEVTEKDLSTSFYYSFGMGIFMYLLLFFAAPFIAQFYDTPILTSLIRVTALNFLWGPLNTPQSVILQRKIDFKTPARISIVNKIVAGIVGISIAYLGYGIWALVISSLVASFIGMLQMWLAVKWIPKDSFSKDSFSYLWNYGNKMIVANLIDVVYASMTPIFVAKCFSVSVLGFYERAYGYVKLPALQISSLLTSVTLPVLSKMQDNVESLTKNYRKMIRMSTFVSFPIFMLLCALSKPFIVILLTEKWMDSVIMLQILCFALIWWPIHNINKNLLQVLGRSDLYLHNEIIKKSIMFLVLIVSLKFGIIVFCLSQILQNFIALYINTYYTKKLINYSLKQQLLDILPNLSISLIMLLSVLTVNQFVDDLFLQIIVGGIVGGIVYLGIAYILKFDVLSDVKFMISKR